MMSLGTMSIAGWVPMALAAHSAAVLGRLQQPVAPHQHFHALLVDEVVVELVDDSGEQRGLVLALAAGTLLVAQQEHLVHAHVQGIGLKAVDQVVQQVEDDLVDVGMYGHHSRQ